MRRLATLALLAAVACGVDAPDAPPSEFAELEAALPAIGTTLPAFAGRLLDDRAADRGLIEGKLALINHWFFR